MDADFLELPRSELADAALTAAAAAGASYADLRIHRITTEIIQLRDGELEMSVVNREVGLAVRVIVDGAKLGDQLPSGPLKVDPGAHTIRFEAEGLEPIEIEVALQKGEKAREVLADFSKQKKAAQPAAPEGPAPAAAETAGRKTPVLVYVLGGVGVLGLASFAYFGSTGKSEEDDLADSCAPGCDPADVDAAHRKMLIADISLGVSAMAFGAAAYVFFTRPAKTESATRLGVTALPGGGGAFVRGSF